MHRVEDAAFGWMGMTAPLAALAQSPGGGALLPVTAMSGGKHVGELASSGRQIGDMAALATHPPKRFSATVSQALGQRLRE